MPKVKLACVVKALFKRCLVPESVAIVKGGSVLVRLLNLRKIRKAVLNFVWKANVVVVNNRDYSERRQDIGCPIRSRRGWLDGFLSWETWARRGFRSTVHGESP